MKKDVYMDLIFTCAVIEYIGRTKKLPRTDVIAALGRENIENIFEFADVYHCEPLENSLIEWEERGVLFPTGNFDNTTNLKYPLPSAYAIGKVYAKIICQLDVPPIDGLYQVYYSFLNELLDDYHSQTIFMPPNELAQSLREGALII